MLSAALLHRFTPDYGVCDFAEVEPHLLSCRGMTRVPKNAKSIIMCIFPYRFPDKEKRELSYYACVNDYHIVVQNVLNEMAAVLKEHYPAYTFAAFTDNSPIPEVHAAARAGLGIVGDNGLLIHPTFGSYVFIGELVTDMPLTPTNAMVTTCEHCGACATACHGGCLPGKDRTNCVSAISQKKGDLEQHEIQLLRQSGLVWGCDTCSEVCPHNRNASISPHPCFDSYIPYLLDADDPRFASRAYAWRGKQVPCRNKELLK